MSSAGVSGGSGGSPAQPSSATACQGSEGCSVVRLALRSLSAQVHHGVTRVVLACGGGVSTGRSCRGTVFLSLLVRERRRRELDGHSKMVTAFRWVIPAKSVYSLASQEKRAIALRLSSMARDILGRAPRHSLRVRLNATLVSSPTVIHKWITVHLAP